MAAGTTVVVETVSGRVVAAGALTAVASWFNLGVSEFVGVLGLLVAVAGFFVGTYFKVKRDKREEELHAKMMALPSEKLERRGKVSEGTF